MENPENLATLGGTKYGKNSNKQKHNPENLNDEHHGPHRKQEMSSGTHEGQSVPAYYTTPTMLFI